jgi:regulator of protease activity HflC (stomatin/prohibitin superfamily)
MLGVDIAIVVVVLGGLVGRPRFRVVRQFERGVVFRWGRVLGRPREDSRLFTVTEASSAANRSIGGRG